MDTKVQDHMAEEAAGITDVTPREYAAEVKTASGTSNLVRFIDGSNTFRKCSVSWFLCDDDKIRPFTVENDHEGQGVLGRLLGDSNNYFKGGYLESKKGQFGKINTYQAKDPELFKRLTDYWNPSYNGTGTCKPKKDYVFNVLHRNPELVGEKMVNWCDINKHTKLLRLGPKFFKCLKTVRDNDGEFTSYDIILNKEGTSKETVFTVMKAGLNITEYKKIGELTELEKAYERFDLKYETRLASATYILKFLRNTIERMCRVMDSDHLQELDKQKVIEAAAFQNAQAAEAALIPASAPSQEASIMSPAANFSRQASMPGTATPVVPGVSRVPINSAGAMEICGHCKEQISAGSVVCPKCGKALQAACEICHNPFSVFAAVCPSCGQQYAVKK